METRGTAARKYAMLRKLGPAAATVVVAACTLPRADRFIPPPPRAVVAGAEPSPPAALQEDGQRIVKKMATAYDAVEDYQAEVETVFFAADGSFTTQKSWYTFRKPHWIRLDFVSPHPGMVIIYPDRNGKVLMRPQGLLSIFTFHLELDDPLLENPAAQRLNQTDLGLLIENIRHSVTEQRRGPLSISEDNDTIRIKVLADDHFRNGVETRYEFLISKELWLPVAVDESTAAGVQERKIFFRNLRTNINVPEGRFR